MDKESHLALGLMADDGNLRLLTFGLTEENWTHRNFGFINERNVIANFDNDETKWGIAGTLGVRTYCPGKILDFLGAGEVRLIIMTAHLAEIARQLDQMGVRGYYSAMLLRPDEGEGASFARGDIAREISANKNNIDKVRAILSDGKSSEVLDGITEARGINDNWRCFEITKKIYTPNIYFPDDIPAFSMNWDESFVDAGAYTGDVA
jgi:hypothetical protein